MTIGELIHAYRVKENITMGDFAKRSGLSKGYISMLEKNENPRTGQPIKPTTKTLLATAQAMHISVPTLMEQLNDVSPQISSIFGSDIFPVEETVMIPVVGTVRAGYGGLAFECDMGSETVSRRTVSGYDLGDFFYLRVKGDSMEPRLYEGDLVLVRKQTSVDSGSYAVVTIDDEEGVIKIVEYDKDTIRLISQNHNYPPRVFRGPDVARIRVIGKVIESKSKFN